MARMMRTGFSRTAATVAVLFSFVLAPTAHANGAFPDEFSVHFPAPAPHRIYIGANFGLLVSEDDGATWRYSCEPWVTAMSNAALSGTNVSFYQVTADGAVIAQAVQVTRSADDACTWPPSGGAIDGQVVTDLFPDPDDATLVVAIVAVASGSYLIASHDGGQTFVDPPIYVTNDLLTAIEISRATPGVMYATSIALGGSGSSLLKSTDNGVTWTSTTIPTDSETQPLILTIDPADANTVYLRVVGALTDSIVVTRDGGQTFQTLLAITGQFSSFLRATDGTLYAGTLDGDLYVLPPGATAFTSHSGPHFRCLGQRAGTARIFACGDFQRDGFSLGYSDDDGGTFTRMMSFPDLLGPLTCSPVATNCVAHWTRIQEVLGIYDGGTVGPGPDAGLDGGPGGLDAGSDAGGSGPPPPVTKSSGCEAAPAAPAWLLAVLALVVLGSLRRRARTSA
jgi:MYXO-CTERM domain-containing protein